MLERYVIVERIAVGGMGEVFVARQQGVGGFRRIVVLKHLLPDAEGNDDANHRLLDEARIVGSLSHDNVVAVIEVGQKDERPFIAFEYVHGENAGTLRSKAAKRDLLFPVVVAARIVADAARGLHHAHAANDVEGKPLRIIHRDVAPKNIFVRHDGVAKVGDFGIARADARLSRTATGDIAGTLAYMSPEQLSSTTLTSRSDQFSLGIVFWELLTGRRLFRAEGTVQVVEKILTGKLRPPSRYRADIPADVDAVVVRMLKREAAQRYPDMGEVADVIEAAVPDAQGTVGHAAVAAFVELLVGDDLRDRLHRFEEGAEQTTRVERPDDDEPAEPVLAAHPGAPAEDGEPTLRLPPAVPAAATGTSPTRAAPDVVVPLATRGWRHGRAGLRAKSWAAVIVVVALAAFGSVALLRTREPPEEQATREYLAHALVLKPLSFRDAVVVDAAAVGVEADAREQLADQLTSLLEEQLRLAEAHYRLPATARQQARVPFVQQEQEHASRVTAALGELGTQEFRDDVLSMWRSDSRAPLRWYPAPTLEEIQQRLYPAGIAFVKETHDERQAQVDRMVARAGADPKAVQRLIGPLVQERELLIERFGTAPPEQLASLEKDIRQVVVSGVAALRKVLPDRYAEAIAAVAFVEIPDTSHGDPFIEDSR